MLAPQAYAADVDDTNAVGPNHRGLRRVDAPCNAYATYATGFKSVGLNLNGVPTDALEPARAVRRSGQARRRPQLRGRREDGSRSRRDGEPHRLRHRDQEFPGAGHQRAASACFAGIWPTPRRSACAAPSSMPARGSDKRSRSTAPPPTPTACTYRSPMRRRRSRRPADRR